MSKRGFRDADVADQSGKTFLITGANTGLGFEASRVLAEKGARVLLGCRSEEKALAAIEKIRQQTPAADLDFVYLDQGDLASVENAAAIVSQESRLDGLINNAGILMPPYELTKDGFESQFGVNHLGTFALTAQLLDKLSEQENSRVIITSSLAHRAGKIHFDDINAEKNYSPMGRYTQSKLANLLFMRELNARLEKRNSSTIAVACHPGIASTELSRHLPILLRITVLPMLNLITNTPLQGSWPTLMAATYEDVKRNDYFGPRGFREYSGPATKVSIARRARHEENCKRLWDLSIEMTGVDPGI